MLRVFSRTKGRQEAEERDTHSILAAVNSGDTVKITARFEGKTWKEISNFARQKGYTAKDLLPVLFSYGVTEKEGVDVEKRRSEMFILSGKYSAMRFEAYQIFTDDRALTMALSTMLPENKKLRKLAEEMQLIQETKEEWDSWDQEKVDGFYKKYVFVK